MAGWSVRENGEVKKTISGARLTYDELLTVIVEVEMILNCRPLSYVSSEDSEEPLTPSHLLCGRRLVSLPDSSLETVDCDLDIQPQDLGRLMKHLIIYIDICIMTGSHGFRRSVIFALFFLFIGSICVSNYIKWCLTTENAFWSDVLVRKVATSAEKPGFVIWFRPTLRYGFSTVHPTNNRADSSPCKLFSFWKLRHIATIFSSAKVGILTRERNFKRCKHPCLYYSNSSATP